MEDTAATWIVAILGIAMIALLSGLQLVAVVRPRGQWTIENVYGGTPEATDPTAYFAFNQASAWADPFVWDRDLGFRENTLSYWLITWGMWPVFGIVEGL
jgi:hypothetical protein